MDKILNLIAGLTGAWKKVAAWLPLLCGAGSLLLGVGGFLIEVGKAADFASAYHILSAWQSDPNTALVTAGLLALGVHTNHNENKATIAEHTEALAAAPTATAGQQAPQQDAGPKPGGAI